MNIKWFMFLQLAHGFDQKHPFDPFAIGHHSETSVRWWRRHKMDTDAGNVAMRLQMPSMQQ